MASERQPEKRPEAETLAMLQNAFKLADRAEEKRLVVQRASTVRMMESVTWLAGFLDDPALAQAVCGSIVGLARHRFLRHPNMRRFGPILKKVGHVPRPVSRNELNPEESTVAKLPTTHSLLRGSFTAGPT